MTEEVRMEVIRKYWEGSHVKDIAKELGFSEWSVRKVLQQAGGKLPKRPGYKQKQGKPRVGEKAVEEINALALQGFTVSQIVEITGCSASTVRRYFPEVKDMFHNMKASEGSVENITVQKNVNIISDDVLLKMRYMVEDETPLSEISKTLGVSTTTVKKYFPNAGVGRGKGASVSYMLKRLDDIADQWGVK